mmetsp:Transcript_8244/g.13806  ORF Transcript_8244/g.13806 Transcript_8244/m.13806 type:complete len:206 (+) Transcript_8244:180-797(+)
MGLFLFFMILFGAMSRFVNGSLCVNVKHTVRVGVVTVFTFCSFIAIAVACIKGSQSGEKNQFYFYLSVFASIFTGVSQSFGEAAILGFLKGYPSSTIGDVGSGTGFAGILASSTLLGSKAIGLSNQTIFFIEAPTIIVYFLTFKWLDRMQRQYKYIPEPQSPRDTKVKEHIQVNSQSNSQESPRIISVVDDKESQYPLEEDSKLN